MKIFKYFLQLIWVMSWVMIFWGPLGARLGVMTPLNGFLTTLCGFLLCLVPSLEAIWALIRRRILWPKLLSLLPVLWVVFVLSKNQGVPAINDISTNLDDPPRFDKIQELEVHHGRDLSYPESFKAEVRKAYPDLRDHIYPDRSSIEVIDAAVHLLKSSGYVIHQDGANGGSVEASETTGLFGFTDDVVLRINKEDSGVRVSMRSKSRDGKSDFGKNNQRIQSFLQKLDEVLSQSEESP